MSFQPVLTSTGVAGWRFLQRTYQNQFEAFSQSAAIARDTDQFLARIGQVKSAGDLVQDRQLLTVALGAFGLQNDLDNRFFVQKILEDGVAADDALANRLADKRYREFSAAFGFGPGATLKTGQRARMEEIVADFRAQTFEIAVGETDDTMRVALYGQRELPDLAAKDVADSTKWYTVLGLPPLRNLFQVALGLPTGVSQVDIDKQVEIFREKLDRVTGSESIAQFSDPENL
ncbi:MAG: DUF1217 domain-containing protein, partial [Pseudomonadota bacterium]